MRPPGARYCAVLFDALGTLVELEPPWPILRRVLASRHGVEVSEADAREAMLAEMAYYREHHMEGADEAALAELRQRCALVLRRRLPAASGLSGPELVDALLDSLRFTPYPDAAPTLAELRRAGLRLAVVSNWDCSLRSILAELGLAAAVDAVVVSAETGSAKPDMRIFQTALEELRCQPQESLFVGDSLETDVAGARAAGLRAFLLERGEQAQPGPADAERLFALTDLLELVLASSRR
jgi:putative hydrolase of the HAD superfamily